MVGEDGGYVLCDSKAARYLTEIGLELSFIVAEMHISSRLALSNTKTTHLR
jgi:hypothetical protein